MKKIIRLLKKRGSGGFTLVEMIVSVALLAVLMAGMMIFISPVVRSFNDQQTDNNAENTTTCVQEYITRNLRNAFKLFVIENTSYTDIQANDAYKATISQMNKFCNDINGTGAINKTYVLNCMSLRYDSTDKRYYLYEESVNMNSNGSLDTAKSKKVFADCLYDDLYITYDFAVAKNGDYVEGGSAKEYRNDAIEMQFATYGDEGYSNLIFEAEGITQFRQIKGMLADGGNESDYFIKVEPSAPLKFADMTDGSRDIYIYYVTRRFGTTTTP